MNTSTQKSSQKPIVVFENVKVSFGNEIIYNNLSFSVNEGEFLCLLGPSGCGKSTTLRVMGDLLKASGGRCWVDGEDAAEGWHKIAYVFQSHRLAQWRTALENVILGIELRFPDMKRSEMKSIANKYLELVGLRKDQGKYPRMLSGGERQRVAIARALAVNPKIILMDEPFSALDPNTRRNMRSEIISIWQETGKTIIFVTHAVEEALILADRILLLSNKPCKILETVDLHEERPRVVSKSEFLRDKREHLHMLFRQCSEEPNQN